MNFWRQPEQTEISQNFPGIGNSGAKNSNPKQQRQEKKQ